MAIMIPEKPIEVPKGSRGLRRRPCCSPPARQSREVPPCKRGQADRSFRQARRRRADRCSSACGYPPGAPCPSGTSRSRRRSGARHDDGL